MKNLEKYRSVLNEDVDGLFLTSRYSRMYAAEFDISEGYAIVGKNGARYFTDSRYIESAQKGIHGFEVVEFGMNRPLIQAINETIKEFGITKLGFEEEYLTVAELNTFQEKIEASFIPVQKKINAFRASKEPWELERMIKAQEITDKAFSEVCTRIQEGMSEKELAAELIYCLYKNGAEGLSFDPIVVSGPNTSMPHGVPGERKLQKGDFITMDFGVIYQGYCSDMTRTVALGYATDEMKKVYDTVLKAQQAGIALSKAGVTGQAVDQAARDVIAEAGYGEYFGHGYGHSLGLEIHESPNCNPRNDQPMPENAVASAEPGIYLPDKFGVRIEDVVIFEADGCRNITHSPKELLII
ncbi:MAG: aminopeptidase P family protein [Ruminococcaceae bacterium]|nr:aminopeptidase P family protein [Oscillospiraceae bacterium]